MWLLYQAAVALGLVLGGPILLLLRGRHYLATLPGRLSLGMPAPPPASPLWIHAVSVGEVGVAATLARAFPADLPLLVTTITPTGQARARALFAGRATVAYLPFELGFAVRRFLRRYRPRSLVLVEGDLWPLLLHEARRRGVEAVVVNGRVSDRSFPRLSRLRRFLGPLFDPVSHFAMQTREDRARLLALGVDDARVEVTGNLKYETPAPAPTPALDAEIVELAARRPILVAGSTMAGEEELVLDAFAQSGGGARALLLLAPRHPERFAEVAALLARGGLDWIRRSQLPAPAGSRPAVVLLDTLGELASVYRLSTAAFIGGTLVPKGGHNPLEAARWGKPIAVGASMENFREMAEHFDRARAWARVDGARGLASAWALWLDDPSTADRLGERAQVLIDENRGALARTLGLLAPLLARHRPEAAPLAVAAGASESRS
jgi:3-deoxy-D-manno-octulosonic-acid transferase